MKVFEIKRVNIFNVSLEFMQDTKEPNPVLFVEKKTNEKRDNTFGWTRIKKNVLLTKRPE